jgi:hypothetical protein
MTHVIHPESGGNVSERKCNMSSNTNRKFSMGSCASNGTAGTVVKPIIDSGDLKREQIEEYLRVNGRSWPSRSCPEKYGRGAEGACFANATRLVMEFGAQDQLQYCEGVASLHYLNFSFIHAWAIDRRGFVIDNTYDDPTAWDYVGVIYPSPAYRAHIIRVDDFGVLRGALGSRQAEEALRVLKSGGLAGE